MLPCIGHLMRCVSPLSRTTTATLDGTCEKCCYGYAVGEGFSYVNVTGVNRDSTVNHPVQVSVSQDAATQTGVPVFVFVLCVSLWYTITVWDGQEMQ